MAQFICSSCGYGSSSWLGRCPSCSEWNTLVQEKSESKQELKTASFVELSKVKSLDRQRKKTQIFEFDRVLGGGFVPGQVTLLAGEPGVGKSTLLLKSLANLRTVYVSGEESADQIRDRVDRIKVTLKNFLFSESTQVEGIIKNLETKIKEIDILVIDSIQTLYSKDIPAAAGNVSQLKEVSARLIDFAKRNNICLILIGHITKGGDIAGPKTLEHLVDCVLYFEGEQVSNFRILRSQKNRFGDTAEVGIFEMGERGLSEVKDPTAFLDENANAAGTAIVGVIKGSRPLFFEVQTLSVSSTLPTPRRVTKGVDYNKVQLLLAVLKKNLNLPLDRFDIYVNVAGGLQIASPSADLGIAFSIISSMKNISLPKKTIFIGEVGLLGEIRKVLNEDKIIKEAGRLGFTKIYSSKNVKSIKDLSTIFK